MILLSQPEDGLTSQLHTIFLHVFLKAWNNETFSLVHGNGRHHASLTLLTLRIHVELIQKWNALGVLDGTQPEKRTALQIHKTIERRHVHFIEV